MIVSWYERENGKSKLVDCYCYCYFSKWWSRSVVEWLVLSQACSMEWRRWSLVGVVCCWRRWQQTQASGNWRTSRLRRCFVVLTSPGDLPRCPLTTSVQTESPCVCVCVCDAAKNWFGTYNVNIGWLMWLINFRLKTRVKHQLKTR